MDQGRVVEVRQGFEAAGKVLEEQQAEKFALFWELLEEWSWRLDLTTIRGPEVVEKHFLDSLMGAEELGLREGTELVDVGSGGGFPGIPLKIYYPGVRVTLLEKDWRKSVFLREVIRRLKLAETRVVRMRAEEAGREKEFRERFEVAVSRAVAPLDILAEYCLPLVKPGGCMGAYKGPGVDEEIRRAEGIVRLLGGEIERVWRGKLPSGVGERAVVIVRKTSISPERYPGRRGHRR